MTEQVTGPKAAGCVVTWDDLPRMCASCAVYGSALGFGSGLAALGAAVSSLAAGLEVPDTSVGQFFTCRGLGVMAGALISAKLMDAPSYFSKHFICSMAIVVAGVSLAAVPLLVESYGGIMMNVVRFLFLAEGLSFGFVESYSTIAIAEMWGQRQQPWMQMKNLMSGSGAILAPVLIGKFGYTWAFCLIALIGFVSIIGLIAENIVLFLVLQRTSPEKWEVIEQKHLPFDESESKQEHLPLSPINLHGQINAFEAACTSQFSCQAPLEPLDQSILHAKELNILTDSLVAIDENEELDMPVWHDLVEGILDHTEYHVLPQDTQPIDHSQANVNRTLSFATPQIVEYIQDRPKEFNVNLLSNFVRMTLAFFVCWHIGLLYSYGGWIGTYIVMRGIEGPQHHGSLGAGLQITTLYYICQTVGSIYSVPASVMFSTTTLMRFQLFLLIAGTSLLFFTFSPYYFTAISACTMGLSLSCIYPLAMTVVNDYGGTMDSASTVAVVLGGCTGESIFPALVGAVMAFYGPVAFEWYVILAALSLVCSYGILHIILQLRVHLPRVEQIKDREQMVEEDSEVDQNKVQDLLSNISPLDTTDRIRLRSVSISRGRARSLSQPRMRSESQPMFMANYGSIVYEN